MKNTSKDDTTVIMSDKYISESGTQGGKVIGEHLALASLIGGIPLFLIGVITLSGLLFLNVKSPVYTADIIAALLVTIIGLLLMIGGYNIFRAHHRRN